jgi:hypothetical protein
MTPLSEPGRALVIKLLANFDAARTANPDDDANMLELMTLPAEVKIEVQKAISDRLHEIVKQSALHNAKG